MYMTKVFPYKHGKCLTWDSTCVNILQDTFLFECAKEAGKEAIGGEKRKDVTYEKLLRKYIFVPICCGNLWFVGTKGTQICQRNCKEDTRKNRQ